ncbi:hypothetical protein INT45_003581 [Circinella minor]|uniref:SLS1 N-terminal domain-containing protein n=1 Tax=Circinella minor TaxID=1195481 RepID=A0A8H7S2V0_9FUNG|nr:hypothetical protein INT45_003581 [Circinella minor]
MTINMSRPSTYRIISYSKQQQQQIPIQRRRCIRSLNTSCSLLQQQQQQQQMDHDLLQSIESHRPKGRNRVINDKVYEALSLTLNQSYTVPQLRLYLKTYYKHKTTINFNKVKKNDLITIIINNYWGFPSRTMVLEAERKRKQDTVQTHFKTNKSELFFIIGDEGSMLRDIEQANDVQITIMVDQGQYMIEGLPKNIARAQQAIREEFKQLIQEDCKLKSPLKEGLVFNDVVTKVMPIIPNISKQSKTFISVNKDNKFTFAALSKKSMDQAKLLLAQALSELNISNKKSLNTADYTFLNITSDNNEFEFMPLHDSQGMPLATKPFGWSRISHVQKNQNEGPVYSSTKPLSFFNLMGDNIDSEKNLSELNIKELLQKPFHFDNDTNIHLEARQPPANITAPLIPVMKDQSGVHRRSVVLDYVNRNTLIEFQSEHENSSFDDTDNIKSFNRIRVEFLVQEDGSLILEKAEGENNRSVIDLISMAGHVDIRLLAKQFTAFKTKEDMIKIPNNYSQIILPNSLQSVIDQCELTGYSDFYCPQSFILESPMDLLEVSFKDEAHYLTEQNLVTLSDIDAQYSQARRTELMVTPIENEDVITSNGYYQPKNGLDKWNSFIEAIQHVSKRWYYSFK